MSAWVAVAAAGSVGALSRWWLVQALGARELGSPWAILIVNVLGCAVFGLGVALFDGRFTGHETARTAVLTGFLGAFTTFSSFAWETVSLVEQGRVALAVLNVGLQNGAGLVGLWLGLVVGRGI